LRAERRVVGVGFNDESMKVTLLIPTLNEIEGMRAIMPRVRREWCDQILVVDGGSTDGTVEYAREQGYSVHVQKRKGLRHGYTEALSFVEGDVIVTFSPDGNSIPEVIPALIEKMREGYDMVIASRYLGHAKSHDDDCLTAWGNWFITKTINILFGARYTDSIVMFRAYRKSVVYDLGLHLDGPYATAERLFRTEISWEPILSVRAARHRLKVAEIPADEPPRIGGQRKLRFWKWGGAYYCQFVQELAKAIRGSVH
jgi:glycosyltransferase involved in cell wall biosynthesis